MMSPSIRNWAGAGLLLWALAGCGSVAPDAAAPGRAPVEVQYLDPAAFTEWRRHPQAGDAAGQPWMRTLTRHLQSRAPALLPPGAHLLVQFTDVELAGSYEPWRGPALQNVRIVRDLYPPRIDLAFRLTDANGRVLEEGRRELRDPAFLMRARSYPNEAQGYEMAMLDDWLGKEFGRPSGK